MQDALLQALSHLGAFRPRHDGALQAYLRQAVHHRILDLIKQARRRPVGEDPSLEPADPAPSPLEQALGADALQRYEAALAALRDEDREAIVLRVELHCEYAQIAGALGKPSADAARMSVGRALVRLAEEMDRRDRPRSGR